jgi:hypothetical protein
VSEDSGRCFRPASEAVLDGSADLHVVGLVGILRPALGFVGAVEELKPEIELRQYADGADTGNADFRAGCLAQAQLRAGDFQALAGPGSLRKLHHGSWRCLLVAAADGRFLESQRARGQKAQDGSSNGSSRHDHLSTPPKAGSPQRTHFCGYANLATDIPVRKSTSTEV